MKQSRLSRGSSSVADEFVKRPAKLEPIRKSGREKQSFLDKLLEDEEIEDYKKKESVFDYFDDPADDEDSDLEDTEFVEEDEFDEEEPYKSEKTVGASV